MSGDGVDGSVGSDQRDDGQASTHTPPGLASGTAPARDQRDFGDWCSLDPRFLTTERISSLIVSGVLALGGLVCLGLDLAFGWWPPIGRVAVWIAFGFACAGLAWLSLAWPRISMRAVAYRHGQAGIEIRRGVWWRRVITIPAARIQHTDVTQGPMLRRFGLAILTVHTAATRTPSLVLSGLAHEEAMRVRDALTRESGGEGV
jgi:membrane protein YdbS with pleckstrin-like domain